MALFFQLVHADNDKWYYTLYHNENAEMRSTDSYPTAEAAREAIRKIEAALNVGLEIRFHILDAEGQE